MKIARLLAFVLGLAAFAFTADFVYRTISIPWDWNHIWSLLYFWPRNLLFTLTHLRDVTNLPPLEYGFLAVQLGAPIFSINMAKLLNRSRLDWFVLTLIFPFTLAILALLGRGQVSSDPYGGFIGYFFAAARGKFCGRCGKAVPLSSHAGQSCPFCGAYWSYERTMYR